MSKPGVGNPSPPKRLEELAARALVGVDRAGGGKDGAAALLREAAVVGAMARAGRAAGKAGAVPETCPAETRESAPGSMLVTLLRQPEAAMIEEWAELADAKGLRVPEALVPGVLEWWAAQPRRSEVVFRVLGQRGDWLASLNPSWKKPVAREEIPTNASEVWETGTTAERVAVLRTVRRADPARALTMLQATWKTDGAAERAKFVEALEEGLSLADEAFLETCLDDRSKQVRESAVIRLIQLPESAFASRMLAISLPMFEINRRGKGKTAALEVNVTPPSEFDPAWERDGIEEKPPAGTGKRAWWLQQLLERTPVCKLGTQLEVAPDEFLSGLGLGDFALEVRIALTTATQFNGDREWKDRLYRHRVAFPGVPLFDLFPLWVTIPAATQIEISLDLIQAETRPAAEVWVIATSTAGPLSAQDSIRICKALASLGKLKEGEQYRVSDAILAFAHHLHLSAADAFEEAVRAAFGDELIPSIQKSLDRLRLRAQMHKEFAS